MSRAGERKHKGWLHRCRHSNHLVHHGPSYKRFRRRLGPSKTFRHHCRSWPRVGGTKPWLAGNLTRFSSGLATALAISRFAPQHDLLVLEASSLGESGAGLTIMPNGKRTLEHLGIYKDDPLLGTFDKGGTHDFNLATGLEIQSNPEYGRLIRLGCDLGEVGLMNWLQCQWTRIALNIMADGFTASAVTLTRRFNPTCQSL